MAHAPQTLPSSLALARSLLGVGETASPAQLSRAFRKAAKAAHPDKGGDAERFRQVVDAHRLLAAVAPAQRQEPAAPPTLDITPLEALRGRSEGGPHLPPGLRTGDIVHACGGVLKIRIVPSGDLAVVGDDLWLTVRVQPRLLEEGGRLEVETPGGPRNLWVGPGLTAPVRLVLEDEGLPARHGRPAGRLYIRLQPDAEARDPARARISSFAGRWSEPLRAVG
jgi:curved DNA-binding protein